MPPLVPRKLLRSPSPASSPRAKGKQRAARHGKPTVFDAIDTPQRNHAQAHASRKLLEELNNDDESLSEVDSDELEDSPPTKKRKPSSEDGREDDDDDDGDEMDWEDAIPSAHLGSPSKAEPEITDISFSIKEDGSVVDPGVSTLGVSKKGPSKRERHVRVQTHCLHVQFLLWHNTIRNSWLNDGVVQRTLVDGLPEGVKREVTRWKEAMGYLSKEELEAKKKAAATKSAEGKRGAKRKRQSTGRDWNYEAGHSEQGVPNLSAGDPLLRLLKVLTVYWRKRFTTAAPGLRKQGYMPLKTLRDEIKDWEKNQNDSEAHGERVEDIGQFRRIAKECEGSRDIGAQLFTALLRGLGFETRMVANLQPSGFAWSKAEDADPKRIRKGAQAETVELGSLDNRLEIMPEAAQAVSEKTQPSLNSEKPTRISSTPHKAGTNREDAINLDSDSPLSSTPSDAEEVSYNNDDLLVVDNISLIPKKRNMSKKYDLDLAFPNYWVEVCSPVSNKYIPVDPIVLSTIASNNELLQTFEPRGKRAEKSKQVMCYTAAFSADGTAKDVTVRYLKKHQPPGKTRGVRMPIERVPVYTRNGKVKKYEEYDWFRTVMSLYDRPENKRTAADDLEEQTDLKPFKPVREDKEVERESLQWYRQSADYVLEQHLRREEAIVPGARSVKIFIAGKGDKRTEHPVFRRQDVVTCKTVESWHKEGRAIKMGEQPIKLVPMRAVTLIRKREMEDAQRETGEKLKQGLYSTDQTDWIIPPPIKDGIIPKNAFGNMDVYVPTMIPKGAVHVPLKGTARICRKLGIDYAEACTGFEFGKQRAVPVLTGVVVAEEHEMLVCDAWQGEQAEIRRKEDTKRTGVAMHWWRKMLLGLRVIERMRLEYQHGGGSEEEINPFVGRAKREGKAASFTQAQTVAGDAKGGDEDAREDDDMGGGFLIEDGADEVASEAGGGSLVEEDAEEPSKGHAPVMPMSLQSLHRTMKGADDGTDAITLQNPKSVERPRLSKPRRKGSSLHAEDTDESSLSEFSELSGDGGELDGDAGSDAFPVPTKDKPLAPTGMLSSSKSAAKAKAPTRSGYRRKEARRFTSEYFPLSEDDGESDVEVVKPRQTTARTRART